MDFFSFNGFLSFVNWIISGTRLGECFFFNWFLNAFSFLMPQLHCFCWAKGVVHVRRKKKNQEQNCCVGLMCPWGKFFWVSIWTKLLYKALKLRLFSGTFDNNFWLTQSLFNSEKFCRLQIIAVRSQNHAYWILVLCQSVIMHMRI